MSSAHEIITSKGDFEGGGVVFKTITVFYYKSKIKFILEILEYTVKYKEDKNQL